MLRIYIHIRTYCCSQTSFHHRCLPCQGVFNLTFHPTSWAALSGHHSHHSHHSQRYLHTFWRLRIFWEVQQIGKENPWISPYRTQQDRIDCFPGKKENQCCSADTKSNCCSIDTYQIGIPHNPGLDSAMKVWEPTAAGCEFSAASCWFKVCCWMKIQNPNNSKIPYHMKPFSRSFCAEILKFVQTHVSFQMLSLFYPTRPGVFPSFQLNHDRTLENCWSLEAIWNKIGQACHLNCCKQCGDQVKSWCNIVQRQVVMQNSSWHGNKLASNWSEGKKQNKIPRLQQCASMTSIWQCMHSFGESHFLSINTTHSWYS